jgi:hypothetical protein
MVKPFYNWLNMALQATNSSAPNLKWVKEPQALRNATKSHVHEGFCSRAH